jgi:hypothetical protein
MLEADQIHGAMTATLARSGASFDSGSLLRGRHQESDIEFAERFKAIGGSRRIVQ